MAKKIMNRKYRYSEGEDTDRVDATRAHLFVGMTFTPFYKDDVPESERVDVAPVVCDLSDLPEEMIPAVIAHGLNAKVGDSGADSKGIAAKLDDVRETWERMCEGLWATEREGGGPRLSDLAAALAEVLTAKKGVEVTVEKAAELLAGEHGEVLKKDEQVKAVAARLRAERAQKKADEATESVLDTINIE